MTKGAKSDIRAHKLDALRMKKYYSYFVKQNCKKDIKWLMEHAMSPLDHLFDDHHLCDSTWCNNKNWTMMISNLLILESNITIKLIIGQRLKMISYMKL